MFVRIIFVLTLTSKFVVAEELADGNGTDHRRIETYIGVHLASISDFNTKNMDFDVDMFLRRSWFDVNQAHDQNHLRIMTDSHDLEKIPVPSLNFMNSKIARKHDVTVPNVAVYIRPDGTISHTLRVTATISCMLRLYHYPLDEQRCLIKISNFAYPEQYMKLSWFPNEPVTYDKTIQLAEFSIVDITPGTCTTYDSYAWTRQGHKIDKFSCLQIDIHVKREIGFHLVQTFIPTAMIVMISWVSFWLDRRAVAARVSLSFTTLLTLSTLASGLRYSLPPVSYAKAIDYWMGTCMIFVFAALLEFAVVNSFVRRSVKHENLFNETRQNTIMMRNNGVQPKDLNENIQRKFANAESVAENSFRQRSAHFSRYALMVDKLCRAVFPLLFVLFNCFYWVYYLK